MTKIIFNTDVIKFISLFESMTQTKLVDCIVKDDKITFIVEGKEIGKAVGKQGANVRRLENGTKKKIRIIAYSDDMLTFVQNVFYPSKIRDIKEEEGIISIMPQDTKSRGYMIGRGASTLREYEGIIKRHFEIKEVKVL